MYQWTVGGQTFQSYNPSVPSMLNAPTMNTFGTKSSTSFYWFLPDPNNAAQTPVACAVTIPGQANPTTVTGYVNVEEPQVHVDAGQFTSGAVSNAPVVIYGDPTNTKHPALNSGGMSIPVTVQMPRNWGGNMGQWTVLQTVSPNITVQAIDHPHSNADVTVQPKLNNKLLLDGGFPALPMYACLKPPPGASTTTTGVAYTSMSQGTFSDLPAIPVDDFHAYVPNGSGSSLDRVYPYIATVQSEVFTDYVMFKPPQLNDKDSAWVPVQTWGWTWGGSATVAGSGLQAQVTLAGIQSKPAMTAPPSAPTNLPSGWLAMVQDKIKNPYIKPTPG